MTISSQAIMDLFSARALIIVCFVCVNGGVLKNEVYDLDIVHYNDFHARFEETTVSYPVCESNDSKCLGGFARLYQEIMTVLKEKPGAILLNAGDTFQGTFWYTLMKWNVTQTFINLLPNDAHAIGNHEFDDGIAGIAPYLAALKAPVLAANLDTTQEPSLNGLYKPHIVIEKKGRKIGIIGLITTETKATSNPGKVIFLDPVEIVEKEAKLLTDEGVDIIVVLSHCGLNVDKQIARTVGDNIDVIIGGHSHSLLWNGDSPSNETISGPYPFIVESETKPGHKVLIVTASAFSKYLGNVTIHFDKQGELQGYDGSPVYLNRSIPEDPHIKSLLQPYADKLHSLVNEVIGVASEDMLAQTCGSGECGIGDFIADSFLNAAKEMKVSNRSHVVFLLRNMIRGSIRKGDISRGSVINTMPFTNTVVTFALAGRYLLEAFQVCMSNYWVQKPFQGPWMPQIAGLHLTLDMTNGLNITASMKEGEEYQPLDLDKEYQVTTLDFLTRPGKRFDMLKKYGHDVHLVGKDTDVLENYIRMLTPIRPSLDNRLTVLN